ncbi:MAG: response regulator [Vicinamibacterales bacterium]
MGKGPQVRWWIDQMLRRGRSADERAKVRRIALVVDDEEAIVRFVERVLTEAGFQTVSARDGVEAVAVVATMDRVDLLVTDLMMPNMTGDELARRVRALEPDLPVLYLTGFSDRLFADRTQLWEREAFVDKPCTARGLLQAVSLVMPEPVAGCFGQPSWEPRVATAS